MKLGNTSQSVVPVPNFFLTRSFRDVDTFNVSHGKRYFRETDLFRLTKDINLSNNPRKNHHKYDELNKEKYIPIHKRGLGMYTTNMKTFRLSKNETDTDKLRPTKFTHSEEKTERKISKDNFKNFTNFMEKTNVSKIANGDIREGIKSNLKDLLEKINTTYDMKQFNQTDVKAHYLSLNSVTYSTLTVHNQFSESETNKFKNTLRDKVNSMTVVDPVAREKALHNFDKSVDQRESNRITLPSLEYFNRTAQTALPTQQLPTFNSNYNQTKEDLFNTTTDLNAMNYKQFLRPAKKNFNRKKEKESIKKMKETDQYLNIIRPENYNATKHRNLFCENYNVDEGAANIMKSTRDMNIKTFN